MNVRIALVGLSVLIALTGCGPTRGRSSTPATKSTTTPTVVMICSDEAQRDITEALGVAPSEPPRSSWSGQVYSCRYGYDTSVMVLSVKEFPDGSATAAYLAAQRGLLVGAQPMPGLGQEAFAARDGWTLLVRKDFKVLTVDVTGLPERFGRPPQSRATVAVMVAMAILACWTGSQG